MTFNEFFLVFLTLYGAVKLAEFLIILVGKLVFRE